MKIKDFKPSVESRILKLLSRKEVFTTAEISKEIGMSNQAIRHYINKHKVVFVNGDRNIRYYGNENAIKEVKKIWGIS